MSDGRFSRIERLLGRRKVEWLARSHAVVIGLGAAGSYAVEGLARAGIRRLRVVDFDVVRPSNINRQLFALDSTLGRPKVEVARERIRDINPDCQVEALNLFVHLETIDRVLSGSPDVVVDAIDSLTPKIELITAAVLRGIPLVSCMGAALRTDPSFVRVGPLGETQRCPLARLVRRRLRSRGVPTDFTCVHSTEPVDRSAIQESLPEDDEEAEPFDRGRKRHALGSLPTLTGIFGLTAANAAIQILVAGADQDAEESTMRP